MECRQVVDGARPVGQGRVRPGAQRTLRNRSFDGNLVRLLRKARGLRLHEVAGSVVVSVSQLSRIETGDRQPSAVVVVALADVLGVPLDAISRRLDVHDVPKAS